MPNKGSERLELPEVFQCNRCGLCLSVCPTYQQELVETSSPRGRLNLLKAWQKGNLSQGANLREQVFRCLGCQACTEICPGGVAVDRLILESRGSLEQKNPFTRLRRQAIGGLKPASRKLRAATFLARLYQRGLKGLVHRTGLYQMLPKGLSGVEMAVPDLSSRPLSELLPEEVEHEGERKGRVGYFTGCADNFVFQEVGLATVGVLRRLGYDVVIPKGLACCGMPVLGFGETEIAEGFARRNIELWEKAGVETIVTDCATCGGTLKDYIKILQDDPAWAERAARFSARVKDINEVIAGHLPLSGVHKLEGTVTYHDPCHLRRGQGVKEQPRQVLKSIPGLKYVELPEAGWCCGGAGSYLITHPELSRTILKSKMDHIRSTGATIIATSCPGCTIQLRLGVELFGPSARVVHPVQLIAEALGIRLKEKRSFRNVIARSEATKQSHK